MLYHAVWQMLTDLSEKLTASIIRITLMMDVESSSKTMINIYHTIQYNIPECSYLYTHHHENLKSELLIYIMPCSHNTEK
jgi:hypothetical protein